jgi:hypothetical protein
MYLKYVNNANVGVELLTFLVRADRYSHPRYDKMADEPQAPSCIEFVHQLLLRPETLL